MHDLVNPNLVPWYGFAGKGAVPDDIWIGVSEVNQGTKENKLSFQPR